MGLIAGLLKLRVGRTLLLRLFFKLKINNIFIALITCFNMSNEEKMIDIKCSVCMKCMQMPVSFLKVGKKIEVDAMHMPHICSDCIDKIGDVLGDKKMRRFMEEVNIEIPLNLVPYSLGISIYTFPLWSSIINGNVYKQMEEMGKSDEIAEKLAEEITCANIKNGMMQELLTGRIRLKYE